MKSTKPIILLAEDDADIADLVVMMLQERGVNVSHATNGKLALEMIEENSFDLILLFSSRDMKKEQRRWNRLFWLLQ